MPSNVVYLDNAATTKVFSEAANAALDMMCSNYGNPSSLHNKGVASARVLAEAREQIASLMGGDPEGIFFTSGGSEANNFAVLGAAHAKMRRGKKIVTTAVEHSSIIGAMRQLEQEGFSVTYLKPDASGQISVETLLDAVDEQTILVSMMTVNNETGAIFPVMRAAQMLKNRYPELLVHSDGVQAFGKLPLKLKGSAVDMMSISGHKICAPKGIGALYIQRGVRILPLIHGGSQERGLRAGTENLPGIAAFGCAAALCKPHLKQYYATAELVKAYCIDKLKEIPQVCINSPTDATPYIVNISVPGYRSETMLHFLEQKNIYVSSGSACSKGHKSPVLTAMGLSERQIDSALRISFIYDTSTADIDPLIMALQEAVGSVAHT